MHQDSQNSVTLGTQLEAGRGKKKKKRGMVLFGFEKSFHTLLPDLDIMCQLFHHQLQQSIVKLSLG